MWDGFFLIVGRSRDYDSTLELVMNLAVRQLPASNMYICNQLITDVVQHSSNVQDRRPIFVALFCQWKRPHARCATATTSLQPIPTNAYIYCLLLLSVCCCAAITSHGASHAQPGIAITCSISKRDSHPSAFCAGLPGRKHDHRDVCYVLVFRLRPASNNMVPRWKLGAPSLPCPMHAK